MAVDTMTRHNGCRLLSTVILSSPVIMVVENNTIDKMPVKAWTANKMTLIRKTVYRITV